MSQEEILLIFGMFVVTFGVRYPVMALVGKLPLPESLFRALRYVPPAVLAAIILPAVVLDERGSVALSASNEYLLAGIVTFAVAWRSRNTLLTIVSGMAVLLLLKTLAL